jgi:putative ATP-dependent endonuclease of OLD family
VDTAGWHAQAVSVAELGLSRKQIKQLDRYLDVTKSAMLYAARTVLVEGLSEALLLPAMADLVLAAPPGAVEAERQAALEEMDRFHGSTVILVDGVDFEPYLRVLLTPAGAVRIGQRVAVITDTDTSADGDEPARVTNARAFAAQVGAGTKVVDLFLSPHTFEPTLMCPENEELLREAFEECAPRSQHRWKRLTDAPVDERPELFRLLFVDPKKDPTASGTPISKAEFAHALADRLVPDCGFVVPDNLVRAIRFIADSQPTAPARP